MKLYEIMRLPADAFTGDRTKIDTQLKNSGLTYERMRDESKKLPGDNSLRYFTEIEKRFIAIAILDEKAVVGLMELSPIDIAGSDANLWTVDAVAVDENQRGKKLGLSMYGLALSVLKLTLASGDTQTVDGERMWRSIESVPGVTVKAFVSTRGFQSLLKAHNSENDNPLPDDMDDAMDAIGATYFKTKNYVQFPVALQKGALNNEYFDVYNDDVTTIHLIAQWGN